MTDTTVDQQLIDIEQRLQRSTAIHQQSVQRKQEVASQFSRKVCQRPRPSPDLFTHKLQNLVEVRNASEGRRDYLMHQKRLKLHSIRKRHEERRQRALSKLSHDEEIHLAKAEAFEQRMASFDQLLQTRRKKVANETRMRSEIGKLRGLESREKVQRKTRAMVRNQ